MMNSRTYRRRAAARHAEHRNGAHLSLLETIASYFTERVADSAMQRVEDGAREIVRKSVLQLAMGWIGAAIMTGGLVLLLGAGVKGLEALSCPLWLAYLSTGILAVLVALVTMRGIFWPKEEEVE